MLIILVRAMKIFCEKVEVLYVGFSLGFEEFSPENLLYFHVYNVK